MHDAGVADQLQTNYASDLRSILKTLFEVMATKCEEGDNDKQKKGEEHVSDIQRGTLSFILLIYSRQTSKLPHCLKTV